MEVEFNIMELDCARSDLVHFSGLDIVSNSRIVSSGEAEAVLDALAMPVSQSPTGQLTFPNSVAGSIDLFTGFMRDALAQLKSAEWEFKTLLEAVVKVT